MQRILIPLLNNDIAPRFDLATDVLIASLVWVDGTIVDREEKVVVLDHPSPEDLCRMVIVQSVNTVVCGGIEDEFFDFLEWKGVEVIDDVIGSAALAVQLYLEKKLCSGSVIGGYE